MTSRKVTSRSKNHPLPSRRRILQHFDRHDPILAEVVRQVGPFRLRRNRQYFVVLCKSIIAQQISTRVADKICDRFFHLFEGHAPSPEKTALLTEIHLRGVGLSRQKVKYIQDLSRRFLDKTIRSHQLNYLDNETVIEKLTVVYGIGRWTAEMFLIFSLNRMDVLPVADLGLRAAVKTIYGMKAMPDAKQLRRLGKKWHPLETVATWYAWRSLNEQIVNY